ncbi:hypothetical protein ApDm4_0222 [Acetobacter pomorum]|nr:hypothetical protein ApDm4_0222 [Acetobacter pomorum]
MIWVCGLTIHVAALEVWFIAMSAHVVVPDAQTTQVFQRISTAFGAWYDVIGHYGTMITAGCCANPVTFQARST